MGLLGGLVGALASTQLGNKAKEMSDSLKDESTNGYEEGNKLSNYPNTPYSKDGFEERTDIYSVGNENKSGKFPIREQDALTNTFDVPMWGVKDFINERSYFQKGLGTLLRDPAWFYFKVFFKFDTQYGLLGGHLDDGAGSQFTGENTAGTYLSRLVNANFHAYEKLEDRWLALRKFVKTLSYISSNAPWTFQSVKDLDKTFSQSLDKPIEDRTISIEFLEEAVDMRLTTLFELYRYAAFDYAHHKEIIPENLRKFDMDIVLFQSPLRGYHTSIKDMKNHAVKYKSLNNSNYSDRMSFVLISFQNCEFDINSFSSLFPSSVSDDKPFQLKPTIKIRYDKVYHHMLNEWNETMFGDSGFLWDEADEPMPFAPIDTHKVSENHNKTRREMMEYAWDNRGYYNHNSSVYKAVVEAMEDTCTNALRMVHPKMALGNLYKSTNFVDKAGDAVEKGISKAASWIGKKTGISKVVSGVKKAGNAVKGAASEIGLDIR